MLFSLSVVSSFVTFFTPCIHAQQGYSNRWVSNIQLKKKVFNNVGLTEFTDTITVSNSEAINTAYLYGKMVQTKQCTTEQLNYLVMPKMLFCFAKRENELCRMLALQEVLGR